ncbi:hypothetical protein [Blastococcus deserti]|uniref:hypothetical protein n=1 Tax=Blastococcus deserti TaxID=2259033 RepID=UPI00366C2FFD
MIAETLATLPSGAAEIEESRGRLQQYPDAPEHDLDYLRLRVTPRAPGALDVVIDVYGEQGLVCVYIGGDPRPIELTAPININDRPARPFLDIVREVLSEVTTGRFDGDVTASRWS